MISKLQILLILFLLLLPSIFLPLILVLSAPKLVISLCEKKKVRQDNNIHLAYRESSADNQWPPRSSMCRVIQMVQATLCRGKMKMCPFNTSNHYLTRSRQDKGSSSSKCGKSPDFVTSSEVMVTWINLEHGALWSFKFPQFVFSSFHW